jgi:hypothetical protein
MLRQNSQPEEHKKLYVWPWEEERCSAAEYIRALQGLNHFLKDVDIDQLHTLEDVSAVASLLGHDLRMIAMAKGIRVEKEYYPTQEPYNAQLQQEFVRVLKDAIGYAKEVIVMLP